MNRQKILIVDDSELNREMLKAILGEEYDYAEAEDGAQAILMLQQDMNIDLLLLDINMPKIDGFGVLERLNQFRWIEELPVIMISATEDRAVIERCYSLGITDYIRRPFDSFIVQRRVKNTLTLYANQKRLMGMVSDQIYQNEKDSHVMIGILSHIVEFRNSESAQHVAQWKSAHQVAPWHNLVTPYSIQSAYAVYSRKAIGGNTTSSPQFGHFALEGPCSPRYKISILCSQYGQSRATLVPKAAMLN